MPRLIAPCGLVCNEDCPAYTATQANDAAAIRAMAEQASQALGREIRPEANWCDGCLTEGGRKAECCRECGIRSCAADRGLKTCAECGEYACEQLNALLENTPSAREVLEALLTR